MKISELSNPVVLFTILAVCVLIIFILSSYLIKKHLKKVDRISSNNAELNIQIKLLSQNIGQLTNSIKKIDRKISLNFQQLNDLNKKVTILEVKNEKQL